jgi:hypothetical protein
MNKVKQDEMGTARSTYWEKTTCKISRGKPEGKRQLRRPRRKWEDNIDMDLKRNMTGWQGLDSSGSR